MARLLKRYRNKPHLVTIGGETLSICGCGLSATPPYCDGTHAISESEEPGLYWYDESGQRRIAKDGHVNMRSDNPPQVA